MKYFMSLALLWFVFGKGQSQVNGSYPLVQFPPPPATIADSTLKMYTTTFDIRIDKNTTNESFAAIATEVYNRTAIGGFQSVNVTSFTNTNSSTDYTAEYDIYYTYNDMQTTDANVSQTIGNETFIEDSYTSLLNSTNITISSFRFTGNSLCNVATCYVYASKCVEVTEGVTIQCQSNCLLGYCSNGWCIHNNHADKPSCSCPTGGSDWWYTDEKCHTVVYLWMIIVYFVIVFLAIIITIIVACICTKRMMKRPIKEKAPKVETIKHEGTDLAKTNGKTEKLKPIPATRSNNYQDKPTVLTNQVTDEREELPLPTNQTGDSSSASSSSESEEESGEENKGFEEDKKEEKQLPKVTYYSQVPVVGQGSPPQYISEARSTTDMSSAESSEEDDGVSNMRSPGYASVDRSTKTRNSMFPHVTTV